MTRVLNRTLRGERGFTLIEMLVVIAIIALLLAVAAPKVINSLGKARDTKAKANIDVIQGALEQFREEYGQYPARLEILKTVGLVKQGFEFVNGYGQPYFYAVEVNTSGKNFRRYVLADPGAAPNDLPGSDNNAAPPAADKTPPVGADGTSIVVVTWGSLTGADATQAIDMNHDGDTADSIDLNGDGDTTDPGETETTVYADANVRQYANTRPTKTHWTNYTGPYATEKD